jgi:hypothetical protein
VAKLRLNLHGTCFVLKGKSIGSDQKNSAKKEELLIWRTKNQVRDQGTVQLKDSILLQISPNWFLGNWTMDQSGLKN